MRVIFVASLFVIAGAQADVRMQLEVLAESLQQLYVATQPQYRSLYPWLFEDFDAEDQMKIEQFLINSPDALDQWTTLGYALLSKQKESQYKAKLYVLAKITGGEYKGYSEFEGGYQWVRTPLFKGEVPGVVSITLKATVREHPNIAENTPRFRQLSQLYKIHLMPKLEELFSVAFKVFYTIYKQPQLAGLTASMKVYPHASRFQQLMLDKNVANPDPLIVLYVAAGKEHAQTFLDEIYKVLGRTEGLNLTPRFNRKITSLIYYAQGNADDKFEDDLTKYFEQPGMVHYAENFTPAGANKGYHLRSPVNGSL